MSGIGGTPLVGGHQFIFGEDDISAGQFRPISRLESLYRLGLAMGSVRGLIYEEMHKTSRIVLLLPCHISHRATERSIAIIHGLTRQLWIYTMDINDHRQRQGPGVERAIPQGFTGGRESSKAWKNVAQKSGSTPSICCNGKARNTGTPWTTNLLKNRRRIVGRC